MPKKPLPVRLYVQILIFAALVSLGVLIIWPVQQALYRGMVNVRDNLINSLEMQIGRQIRYSSISPSILGAFDVHNVKIMGEDEHSVLEISRFRIVYSIFDLLLGRMHVIQSIQADSPRIDFNVIRDNDLLDLLKKLSAPELDSFQDFSRMLPETLLVQVRNGTVLIAGNKNKYIVDSLNINAEIANKEIVFSSMMHSGAVIERLIGDPINIGLAMEVYGHYSSDSEKGDAVFTIPSITNDIVSSAPIAFGVSVEKNEIQLWKMNDDLALDFSVSYEIENKFLTMELGCEYFRLRDFIEFNGSLENFRQFQDIALSGNASIERNSDNGMHYLVNLVGSTYADRRMPLNDANASMQISAEGDNKSSHIEMIKISLPKIQDVNSIFYGDILFSGEINMEDFAPDGALTLQGFSFSGNEEINAEISIGAKDGQIIISSDAVNLGKTSLGSLNALIQSSPDRVEFALSAHQLINNHTHYNNRAGTLSINGIFDLNENFIEANFLLDSILLAEFADMALPFIDEPVIPPALNPVLNAIVFSTEIVFSTDFNQLHYATRHLTVSNRASNEQIGNFLISGTDTHFNLSEGQIIAGMNKLGLSGDADFSNPGDILFAFNVNYMNLDYQIEGKVLEGRSIDISGSYGFMARLSSAENSDGYFGVLQAEKFPLPFAGQAALLSYRGQMFFSSSDAWSLLLDRLEISEIAMPAGNAQIRISGRADHNGANFNDFNYIDSIGMLRGKIEAAWPKSASGIQASVMLGDGRENYSLEGTYSGNLLKLAFTGSAMRFDRIIDRSISAVVDGTLNVSWDMINAPNIELNLPSVRGKILDQDFSASAKAVLNKDQLTVNAMKIVLGEVECTLPLLTVNMARGTVETSFDVNGILGRRPLESNFSFAANFSPISTWFDLEKAFNAFSGKITARHLKYGITGEPQTFEFVFSLADADNNKTLYVSGGPRNMLRMQFDQDGNFFAGLSSPFPVRGSVIGSIRDKTINARCSDFYVDLEELFKFLPEDRGINISGGYMNGYVEVKGSITDPEFFGAARCSSVRMQIPEFISDDIRPIPFNANINGNEILAGPVDATVGNGAGTVSGRFLFDRWIPNIFSIDVDVPAKTPIPFDFDIVGFTATGSASGNLIVSMENLILDVSGDININNTRMGYYYDEDAINKTTGSFKDLFIHVTTDINVTTGPIVEFLYPSTLIPLLRANPYNGTKIHVSADTMAQQYSITGDVRIRSGEIFYFERSFYIRSGTLVLRENELRFDPRLTARAEVRDRNDDGPVTISMLADNAPLLSFDARFESTPSLSQTEIFAMMGQSITGSQYDEDTGSIQRAFLSSTSDLLAQFTVVRQIERQIRNFMRLDMFSVRTQALQNAIFMAAGLTQTPVDRIGGVGNYFDNTTLFGGKYIGQDLFIQGMLSMQYDENKATMGGLTLRPDIGIELQNPLFSIRWDFIPTHPENWYINDNSITFTWSRSF